MQRGLLHCFTSVWLLVKVDLVRTLFRHGACLLLIIRFASCTFWSYKYIYIYIYIHAYTYTYISDVVSNLGSKVCEDLNVGFKQLNAGGDCFTIHFEKMNWYEARMQCKQRGHDLATLRHEQQREELANKIWMKFRIFKLYHFWIGFRNSDWFFYNSGGNNIAIIYKIEAKYKAAFVRKQPYISILKNSFVTE